jgi:hypothetical protein
MCERVHTATFEHVNTNNTLKPAGGVGLAADQRPCQNLARYRLYVLA